MRAMDKVMKELHAFIAKKAPNGVKSEEEMQQIIEEFMMQHNEAVQHLQDFLQENGQDDTVPADVYDYLDLAEQASRKKTNGNIWLKQPNWSRIMWKSNWPKLNWIQKAPWICLKSFRA